MVHLNRLARIIGFLAPSILLLFMVSHLSYGQGITKQISFLTLKSQLRNAPLAKANARRPSLNTGTTIELPMPDGSVCKFRATESPILGEEMAKKYPEYKSYLIVAINDRSLAGRLALNPEGLNALLLQGDKTIHIQHLNGKDANTYRVYSGDSPGTEEKHEFSCGVADENPKEIRETGANNRLDAGAAASCVTFGATLRTFRIAIMTTAEFAQSFGGTEAAALVQITNSINDMNVIYERDVAVHFNLVATKIYTDPATDPFNPGVDSQPSKARSEISTWFNAADYDIGHLLHNGISGGGGVAYLRSVCNAVNATTNFTNKAGGYTSAGGGALGNYWLKTLCHEVGHQFGANHTFNASCSANRSSSAAYEPGAGSSIMGYGSTSCDNESVGYQQFFHVNSIESMNSYIGGLACFTATSPGNNAPSANANPTAATYNVPKGTPFTLTGSATDADAADVLTYSWEQYDLGTVATDGVNAGASTTTEPVFRIYTPSSSPSRTFPILSDILNNTTSSGEKLPTVARTLNFRLLVRDNHTGVGGVSCDATSVNITNDGPFLITSQNTTTTWLAGMAATITWSVSGTNMGVINAANVKISISYDGGTTFADLVATTANDGSEAITVPTPGTMPQTQVRIKVEAIGNIFFDINDVNITIDNTCPVENTTLAPSTGITAGAGLSPLNLGIGPVVTMSGAITSTDPSSNLAVLNEAGTGCQSFGNQIKYDMYAFKPTVTGTYTFTNSAGITTNLYNTLYVPSDRCNGFISSSAQYNGSYISSSSSVAATLTAGNTYYLITNSFSSSSVLPINYTITVTPPAGGSIITKSASLSPNGTMYQYVIKDNASDNILAISNTPNLTNAATFPVGTYTVYGITNPTGNSLSSYVGGAYSTLQTDVTGGTVCGTLSGNSVAVTVNSCTLSSTIDTPNSLTVFCVGSSVTLTANAVSPTGMVNYQWQRNGTNTGANSANLSPTTTGVYSVTLSDAGGCTATASVSITFNAVPIPSIGPAISSICVGNTLNLTASGGSTYAWASAGGGTFTPSGSMATFSSSTTGGYQFSVTVTNGSGCTATATASTSVGAIPMATAAPVAGTNVCVGTSLNLTATGGNTYGWTASGGTFTGSGTVNPTFTATSAGGYSFTVTAGNGTCTATASTSVTANAVATPSITKSVATTVCVGSSLSLTAAGTGTYTWASSGGTFSSSGVTATFSSTISGGYQFSVTLVNAGCSATATASTTVLGPATAPTITANSPTVCINTAVQLTASGCTSTVTWSNAQTGAVINPIITGNTSFTAVCDNGCGVSGNSNMLNITGAIAVTTPTIASSATTLCAGNTVSLTAINCNGTLRWNTGQSSSSINVVASQSTDFYATCTNGCGTSPRSNVIGLTVFPTTIEAPRLVSSKNVYIEGEQVQITAQNCSYDVLWSNGLSGGGISIGNLPAGVYTFSAVCKTQGSCSQSSISNTVSVMVVARPVPPTIVANKTTACVGESISLSARACAGTVRWSDGQVGSNIVVPVTVSVTYTAVCEVSNIFSGSSLAVTITPKQGTTITANVGMLGEVCAGQTVTLSASGCAGTVFWNNGKMGNTLQVSPEQTTTYYARCTNDICPVATNTELTLNVRRTLFVSIIGTATVVPGGTIELTNVQAYPSYSWVGPSGFRGTTQTIKIPNATAQNQGMYSLTVSDGTCTNSGRFFARVLSNTRLAIAEDATTGIVLNVSPNPTHNIAQVSVTLPEPATAGVELLDTRGKSLDLKVFEEESTTLQTQFSLQHLPQGLYFVRVLTEKGQATKKVLKQ